MTGGGGWCGGGGGIGAGGGGLRLAYDLFLLWLYKSDCHFVISSDELSRFIARVSF